MNVVLPRCIFLALSLSFSIQLEVIYFFMIAIFPFFNQHVLVCSSIILFLVCISVVNFWEKMLFCVSQVESSSVLGEKERFNEIESLFYNIQLQQNSSIETLVCDYFEKKNPNCCSRSMQSFFLSINSRTLRELLSFFENIQRKYHGAASFK